MTISNRKFGVEIECFGLTQSQIFSTLQTVGIDCEAQEYNHRRSSYWKIVPDGSICPPDRLYETANEIVSPVLSGEVGLSEVKKVVKALCSAGARVNTSCGLHVHVDASGFETQDLVNILRRYAQFETIIDRFMPRTRRENRNTYCNSVIALTRSCIERLNERYYNDGNTRNFISRTLGESRYYKVNLSAYLRHGTVEFRQHSGSVNHKKITNWIRFCVNFVEQSKIQPQVTSEQNTETLIVQTETPTQPQRRLRRDVLQRYQSMFGMISSGLSASVRDLMTISGLSFSGVRNALANMQQWYGIRFNNSIRYINRRTFISTNDLVLNWNNRSLTRQITLQQRLSEVPRNIIRSLPALDINDTWSRGLEPETISFFEQRIQELEVRRTRQDR